MSEPVLWDICPPARRGEDTQAAGAAAIAPRAQILRDKVMVFLRARGAWGATNEEISSVLCLKVSSVCGRVNELKDLGKVIDSSIRRQGRSGVAAKVWIAHEYA
jgi:predicted transcriptional regulator